MTIAVIVPAYNAARFLAPALASISAQERLPDEVWIVDDHSTDNTLEIAREWAGAQPFPAHVISNEFSHEGYPRRGPAGARTTALHRATADLIALLDADDLFLPHHLRLTEQAMLAHPELELCFGDAIQFRGFEGSDSDETAFAGKPLQRAPFREAPGGLRIITEPLLNSTIQGSCIPTAANMFRRKTLLSVGGFDRRAGAADDLVAWNRLDRIGEVAYYPFPLAMRRWHETNVSNNAVGVALDWLSVLHIWEQDAAAMGFSESELLRIGQARWESESALLYHASLQGLGSYNHWLGYVNRLRKGNRLDARDAARAALSSLRRLGNSFYSPIGEWLGISLRTRD